MLCYGNLCRGHGWQQGVGIGDWCDLPGELIPRGSEVGSKMTSLEGGKERFSMVRSCYYIEKITGSLVKIVFFKLHNFCWCGLCDNSPQTPNDLAMPLMLCLK
jgi:hypothetical protein